LSTLALEGSSRAGSPSRALALVRYADLGLLALALPIFLAIGASMLGYGAAAAAWLVQRGLQLGAEAAARRQLRAGVRRNALGLIAAATLVRLWIVTLAILLVGLIGDRSAGLSAAVLSLVLVTISLASRGALHVLTQEEEAAP
jgi:hypothetical protein